MVLRSGVNLFDSDPPLLGGVVMGPQVPEGNHRGSSIVEGCFASQPLGENIFDPCQFKDGADRSTGNHPRTWGGWAHEHTCCSIPAGAERRDRVVTGERDFDEMLLPVGNTFLHCTYDVASLADTHADLTPFIAHDNNGPEAHFLATLDRLGDAADLNNPFVPLGVSFLFPPVTPPAPITSAAAAITTATASSAIRLAFSGCGDVSCTWDVLGQDLVVFLSKCWFLRITGPLPRQPRPLR